MMMTTRWQMWMVDFEKSPFEKNRIGIMMIAIFDDDDDEWMTTPKKTSVWRAEICFQLRFFFFVWLKSKRWCFFLFTESNWIVTQTDALNISVFSFFLIINLKIFLLSLWDWFKYNSLGIVANDYSGKIDRHLFQMFFW